jgi:myo-inositol-1(or 4)-monophosphatase
MILTENDIIEIKSWMYEAGRIALQRQSSLKMRMKLDHTPVTDAEFQIENLFLEKIHARFPDHQILTEEQGITQQSSKYLWALDPVDGTKPYLRGLPSWGVSLGLLKESVPVAGFFYIPGLKELYWGGETGVFFNDIPIQPPTGTTLDDPLIFLAVPANVHLRYDIRFPRIQAYGSTAVHLSFLARGIAAGVLTRRVNLWDIAAFLPIFNKMGIMYEYLSGKQVELGELLNGQKTPEAILAARPEWLSELRRSIQLKADPTLRYP